MPRNRSSWLLQVHLRHAEFHDRIYDYGRISPRKCYRNGQSRNVVTNKRIRGALLAGHKIDFFFYATPECKEIESAMIEALQPSWNQQGIRKIEV